MSRFKYGFDIITTVNDKNEKEIIISEPVADLCIPKINIPINKHNVDYLMRTLIREFPSEYEEMKKTDVLSEPLSLVEYNEPRRPVGINTGQHGMCVVCNDGSTFVKLFSDKDWMPMSAIPGTSADKENNLC